VRAVPQHRSRQRSPTLQRHDGPLLRHRARGTGRSPASRPTSSPPRSSTT
jgi:hypothetical protein